MKKIIKSLAMIAICITFISQSIYAASLNIDSQLNDTTEIQQLVYTYFDTQLAYIMKGDSGKSISAMSDIVDTRNSSGAEVLNYEAGKMDYLIASHKVDGTKIEDYDLSIDILSKKELKDELLLEVCVFSSIKYNFLDKPSTLIDYHTIELQQINGQWYIVDDVYETEFLLAFPKDTDFSKLISTLDVEYNNYKQSIELSTLTPEQIPATTRGTYDSFTDSERSDGAAYAVLYSEDTGDYTSDSYNTSKFKTYGNNDCQNFVSQCIWYGMGGRSSSNKDYPMTTDWWANTSGETSTWNWTGTTYFLSWIQTIGTNIHGNDYPYPTYIKECDYIYVPGHVMIVSDVTDADGDGITDWDEIEICGHTKNRSEHNLKALYGGVSSPPSTMDFVRIYGKFN